MSALSEPAPDKLRAVDFRCDEFERTWSSARRPRIEDYLFDIDSEILPHMREELIRIELELRYRAGEQPQPADYAARFPECTAALEDWLTDARSAAATLGGNEVAGNSRSTVSHLEAPTQPVVGGKPLPSVLGEYELLEQIGKGGMGEVWKARHGRLGKVVALKVLRTERLQSSEASERFLREIRAVGALGHPNLVEASYAGEQDGVLYLVMNFVEGIDLARLVKRDGPRPIAEACALTRQVALGLQYLHEQGLVHRDLKPSNIMRTPDGQVKILDLGLARWQGSHPDNDELTGAGVVLGTPDYLAPEQLKHAAGVDIRADLYGLGGTLFYLLTGKPVFANLDSTAAKVKAHVEQPAPDVRTFRPDVPAPLAELLASLLAKVPEQRPQTPAQVADALAMLGAPRRWWGWGLTAAAAVLLLTLPAIALLRKPASAPPPTEAAISAEPSVEAINITHFETVNKDGQLFARPLGLLGRDSFGAHLKDQVVIEARLSQPAYAFLIAYRTDGTEELCFPESEDEPPPRTGRPRYPSGSRDGQYGLTEGTGLYIFAVVCAKEPLPSYRDWSRSAASVGWAKHPATPGVVWFDDGNWVDALSSTNRTRGPRGKGQTVAGRTALVQLTDRLRKRPGIDAAAAIGFAVANEAKR